MPNFRTLAIGSPQLRTRLAVWEGRFRNGVPSSQTICAEGTSMFELLRFSSGGAIFRQNLQSVDLEEAIRRARELMTDDDQMSVVEVRDNGETVSTVDRGWISRARRRRLDKSGGEISA
jgi:hypothetical protein